MKKLLSIFLAVLMVSSMFIMAIPAVSAEQTQQTKSAREEAASKWDGEIPLADSNWIYNYKSFDATVEGDYADSAFGSGTSVAKRRKMIKTCLNFDGFGTSTSPFLLKSAADVVLLAVYTNNQTSGAINGPGINFKLTVDLDLQGREWPGIGLYEGFVDNQCFKGTFDGDGHVIYNLNLMSRDSSKTIQSAGFFGFVGMGAVVKNLGIASGNVNVKNTTYVGALVGVVDNLNAGSISNCFNYADINVSCDNTINEDAYASGANLRTMVVGGVIGTVRNRDTLTKQNFYNLTNGGNITATKISQDQAVTMGGILGDSPYSKTTINGALNTGNLTLTRMGKDGDQFGLLVGSAKKSGSYVSARNVTLSGVITTDYYDESEGSTNNRAGAFIGGLWSESKLQDCTAVNYDCKFIANGVEREISVYGYSATEGIDTSGISAIAKNNNITDTGYQLGTQSQSIRFVAEINEDYKNYEEIGMEVTVIYGTQTDTKMLSSTCVYSTLIANGASEAPINGDYFIACGLIVPDGSFMFGYRPYAKSGDTVVYGDYVIINVVAANGSISVIH